MILHGNSSVCGGLYVNHKAHETNSLNNSISISSYRLPAKCSSLRSKSSWGLHQEGGSLLSKAGIPLPYRSPSLSPFSSPEQGGLTHLPQRRETLAPPRASNNTFLSNIINFKYPPMKKKPRWWWRTMACFPYIMPFHETWMFASTASKFSTPLQGFQYLTYPFLRFLGRLPKGFLVGYFIGGYLGIVRRKEWPHFIRFNMCLGLLLEISLQLLGATNKWMPKGIYNGKIGTYVWTMIMINHFTSVCGCILCALFGTYADIPFFSDAAYLQIPDS